MIVVDTSILVEAFTRDRSTKAALRAALERGERMLVPTLALYEWLRGPRRPEELHAQEALLPAGDSIPFGADEASTAARLYTTLSRARGREVDIAIAACAITHDALLWTLNEKDFADIPGLELVTG
jgi:predicted nucleic acid-binding protein